MEVVESCVSPLGSAPNEPERSVDAVVEPEPGVQERVMAKCGVGFGQCRPGGGTGRPVQAELHDVE